MCIAKGNRPCPGEAQPGDCSVSLQNEMQHVACAGDLVVLISDASGGEETPPSGSPVPAAQLLVGTAAA